MSTPFIKMKVTGPSSAAMPAAQEQAMSMRTYMDNQDPTLSAMVATTAEMKNAMVRSRKRKSATTALATFNLCMERLRALKSNFDHEHDGLMKVLSNFADAKATVEQPVQAPPQPAPVAMPAPPPPPPAPAPVAVAQQTLPASSGPQAAAMPPAASPIVKSRAKKVQVMDQQSSSTQLAPPFVPPISYAMPPLQDDVQDDDDGASWNAVASPQASKKQRTIASAASRRAANAARASARNSRRAPRMQDGQGLPCFPGKPVNVLSMY